MIPINNHWRPIILEASQRTSYLALREFLKEEYRNHKVYPSMHEIWTAFQWTDFPDVKVVILGQDPYHGPNQAHGLSFSVKPGQAIPPSLRNIYQELYSDLGYPPVKHGYLKSWADQGVLLLNTVLTVRAGQANSHRNRGWEDLTDFAIQSLNGSDHPIVFILWGRNAQNKKPLIDISKHFVLESSHPSPLSARHSFIGSRVFSKSNHLLEKSGQIPINWQLPENINL